MCVVIIQGSTVIRLSSLPTWYSFVCNSGARREGSAQLRPAICEESMTCNVMYVQIDSQQLDAQY